MSAFALNAALPKASFDRASTTPSDRLVTRTAAPRALPNGSAVREDFVDAMSATVTGVNVVTTDGPAGRFGLTVSAMSSVSADPPMVLACINRRSPACGALRVNGTFCLNVLSAQQRHLANTFAGRPARGKPYDFDDAMWTKGSTGAPCLINAVSTFECVLDTALDAGSHTIFIGRVLAATKADGTPLLYTARAYGFPCQWD